MQSIDFCVALIPAIKRLYSKKEDQAAAPIDDASTSSLKLGLMGPLASVGDPIFWVMAALTGSIVGPLIFFVLFNALR